MPVSVLILTLNEEQNLPACLESVSWSDDVVVLDSYSTDRTEDIARTAGARFFRNEFQSFADQRNWGMENAGLKHEWVLHLDADERVPPELASQIQEVTNAARDDQAGFLLCYKTIFHNRWLKHSSDFPVWVLRLVRRDSVEYLRRGHGEGHKVEGKLTRLQNPYLHYNFSKGLQDWFERHNRYSSREAEHCVNQMRDTSLDIKGLFSHDPVRRRRALKRLSFSLPGRPWLKFMYMYVLRLGILDGRAGLTYCALQAVYEYMICVKIRELRLRLEPQQVSPQPLSSTDKEE